MSKEISNTRNVNPAAAKKGETLFWTSTLLLCALMLAAIVVMLSNNEEVGNLFIALGFPAQLVYPLAFMKLAGVLALLLHKRKVFTEWAYAGFFFASMFALAAHLESGVGHFAPSLIAVVLISVSYYASKNLEE